MAWHSRLLSAMIFATVLLAGGATMVFTQPTPWTGNAAASAGSRPTAPHRLPRTVRMTALPQTDVHWLLLFSLMRSRAAP